MEQPTMGQPVQHFVQAVPGIERRITLRLLSYWEKLRRGRAMPAEEDINPEDLTDLWDSCFLVRVKDLVNQDYHYAYLGQAIDDAFFQGIIRSDSAGAQPHPAPNHLTRNFARVVGTCRPFTEEGEFQNIRKETVKYRQCLLPLGTDGEIQAIFGGMTFKIFANG